MTAAAVIAGYVRSPFQPGHKGGLGIATLLERA